MEDTAQKDKLIPAFETAIGIPSEAPIYVSEQALAEVNREVAPVARYAMRSADIASLYAKRAVRPDEIAALRRAMFNVVYSNLPEVEKVVQGKKSWTASQVRLYSLLTERVIPKMQSIALEDTANKKVEELSIEELEALALGKKQQIRDQLNTIDVKAEEIKAIESRNETTETRKEVLRELANIEAMDEAERKYVARLVTTTPETEAKLESKRRERFSPPPKPETLAKVRKKNGRSLEQRWRDAGCTEEEIAQKWKEVKEKREQTRKRNQAIKERRLGLNFGLDNKQVKIAEDIRTKKNETLREFRVNPAKGRRSASAVQKEIERKQRKEKKRYDKEVNPRVYTTGAPFGIEEDLTGIRLQEFKERYPEKFHVSEEDLKRITEIEKESYDQRKHRYNSTGSSEASPAD